MLLRFLPVLLSISMAFAASSGLASASKTTQINLQADRARLPIRPPRLPRPPPVRPNQTVLLDTGAPSERLATGTVIYANQTAAIKFPSSSVTKTAKNSNFHGKRPWVYSPLRLDSVDFILGVSPTTDTNLTLSICEDRQGVPADTSVGRGNWERRSMTTTAAASKYVEAEEITENSMQGSLSKVLKAGREFGRARNFGRRGCPIVETFLISETTTKRVEVKWQPLKMLKLRPWKSYWFVLSAPATTDLGKSLSWLDSVNGTATVAFKEDGNAWKVNKVKDASTAKIIAI